MTWSRVMPGVTVPVSIGVHGSSTRSVWLRGVSTGGGGGGGPGGSAAARVPTPALSGGGAGGSVVSAAAVVATAALSAGGAACFLLRNGILSHPATPSTSADSAIMEGHLIARLLGKRPRSAPTSRTPARRRLLSSCKTRNSSAEPRTVLPRAP